MFHESIKANLLYAQPGATDAQLVEACKSAYIHYTIASLEAGGIMQGADPDVDVLVDVSLTIEPGETIAIVGSSGAGKTTLANLIARMYDVTRGTVKLDGHDVRDVTGI